MPAACGEYIRAGSLPLAGRPHTPLPSGPGSRNLITLTLSLPTSIALRPALVTRIDEHDSVASFQVLIEASITGNSPSPRIAVVPGASIVTDTQLDSQRSGLPPLVGPVRTKPSG